MASKIQEYKSKKWPDTILQIHVQHTLDGDRYMYRLKDTDNFGNAVLTALGVPVIEPKFQDIEKEDLDRQLKEYGYRKVNKKK